MPLRVVRLPAAEAADAVRRSWDDGEPVLVLDPRAPQAEVDRILERARPDADVAHEVAAVAVTSGSAGDPKAVELTWDGLAASAAAVSAVLDAGPGDRWLACLPLHHVAGLAVLGRAWAGGAPVTVLGEFDIAAIAAADATLVSLVPTMVRRLRDAGADLGRFRRVLVGGGPVQETGANIVATYGMTETWGGVVHGGHPLAGVELALAGSGEILVRAPMMMRGYRLDPDRTAAALDGDGWFHTGDVGAKEADGRLRVVDRLGDLIITGGVKVSPREVEAVLAQHPGVADVCVSGSPDPGWGERVVAYVVPGNPSSPPGLADLRAFAAALLSASKLPRQVVIVDAVPRTAGGKPLRRLLGHAPGPGGPRGRQVRMGRNMSNPRGFSMPNPKEIAAKEREAQERQEQEERDVLPDDAVVDVEAEKKDANSDEILDRLDRELVGLTPVKTRIREIADLLVVDRLRHKFGIESTRPTLHMSFTGSPGTGKTTVALRMAEMLNRMGYLAKGHLVNVTRDDLVGQYIGHTAPKTKEVLKRAMGGVLFIDEAYYLYRQENERDYGQETIEILLQIMENNRDDLVVILAGYKDKMDVFFSSNPGMGSRIAHHIHFPDYSLDELMGIAGLILDEQRYSLSEEAEAAFRDYLERRMKQPRFSNGRSVRNALERARLRQATRIVRENRRNLGKGDLMRIEAEDILASRVFDDDTDAPGPDASGGGAPDGLGVE